jgi:hypothetical protein
LVGVDQQVQKHLIELTWITGDRRDLAELARDGQAVFDFVVNDRQRVFDALVKVDAFELGFIEPRKASQSPHDRGDARGPGSDHRGRVFHRRQDAA